jgi:phospholipase A1
MSPRYVTRDRMNLLALAVAAMSTSASADIASELARCRTFDTQKERYDCYEQLAAPDDAAAAAVKPQHALAAIPPDATDLRKAAPASRWSTDKIHALRPHKPNYVIFRQTTAPNNNPFRNSNEFSPPGPGNLELDHNEMKFQLSIKAPLSDEIPMLGASLWFGYTQQSYWQIWNATISRPFRESDYEPEVMLVWNPAARLSDKWTLNHIVGGFVHQSNGRGDPLSRSWNRIYAQFELRHSSGLEVIARPWLRVPESKASDNNIDITRYLGYGDLILSYRGRNVDTSLLVRNNLEARHNRSAFQLDMALTCFTIGQFVPKLQVFVGPGESLIDYNHRQKGIGIGLEATGWFDHTFARPPRTCHG